ncbi:MAG: PLP-dependent aminotransferase family protein [Gammaproteobacteria bacterium]|nr:PLP-dependent aminotransferase family protein [Gammaproteobacteria bacterium]
MNDVPLVFFSIDRDSHRGLQKQIQIKVVEGIHTGKLAADSKMPSTRSLANFLDISRITVSLAYAELAAAGHLVSKDRSGYYVAAQPANIALGINGDAQVAQFEPRFTQQYSALKNKLNRPANWRKYPYCFIYGQADHSMIDHHRWRQCSLEALGRRDFDVLTLDTYESDDPLLLQELMRINLPQRGIQASEDQILITMGALNALWLCAQLFLGPDDTAVIENPCYPTLRNMLTSHQCKVTAVDVDEQGLPLEHIPDNTSVVFATPSHHCPTNISMPAARRKALIEKAKRDRFIIVEDDYEIENQLRNAPKPALKALDSDGHVVYVGSFSKSLFPGLRMGYMVASPTIIAQARALRSVVLRNPPNHTQRTVAYFQSLGFYDRQLRRMARANRERHEIMRRAIEAHGLEFASSPELGGSSFWMKTHPHIDTKILTAKLAEMGVLIDAGAPFFAPGSQAQNYYRLAYSSIKPEKIDHGISLIRKAIDELA